MNPLHRLALRISIRFKWVLVGIIGIPGQGFEVRSFISRGRRAIRILRPLGAAWTVGALGSIVVWSALLLAPSQAAANCPSAAASLTLSLAPTSIVADGHSASTATATVTDASSNPVDGDTIQLSSTDSGDHLGTVTDTGSGTGTYTGTITSTSIGQSTITATDLCASNVSNTATLTKTAVPTTTVLSAPNGASTNEEVTLTAFVTSGSGGGVGGVSFLRSGSPIGGCTLMPVTPANPTARCNTSFSASTSPETLTASFTPYPFTNFAASTSAPRQLSVSQGTTSVSLAVSPSAPGVGQAPTYTAAVWPAVTGAAIASGSVTIYDNGSPIGSCSLQPAVLGASSCAVRRAKYQAIETHRIDALYHGDSNFASSIASPLLVSVTKHVSPPLGRITSTMQWTFAYGPSSTKVMALTISEAPVGANVLLRCHGRGCPFSRRTVAVVKPRSCRGSCRFATVHLVPTLRGHRLRAGATMSVAIVRSRWVGKYYLFTIRSGRAPSVKISCLPAGNTRPAGAC